MRLLALFLFGLLAFTCISSVVGQDEDASTTTTESTNTTATNVTVPVLEPSPDVETVVFFPTSAEKRFPTGKPVQVLVGFTNKGDKAFNVSIVTASLMYPQDWRYYIQNYTKQAEFVVVAPNTQATFAYTFVPDAFLEPREFGLMGNIYYSLVDGSANFTSVYYNSTITLVEPNEPVDLQTFFMYVGIVGIAGLIGFVLFQSLTGLSGKKNKRPKVEVGTQRSNVIDSDWLEGTAAARSPAQKRPKRA